MWEVSRRFVGLSDEARTVHQRAVHKRVSEIITISQEAKKGEKPLSNKGHVATIPTYESLYEEAPDEGELRREWVAEGVLLYTLAGDLEEIGYLNFHLVKSVQKDTQTEPSLRHLLIDLSGVTFLNSGSGTAFVVAAKYLMPRGGSVRLIFEPQRAVYGTRIRERFDRISLGSICPTHETVGEALAAIQDASRTP